jgi:hypothetical protein
MADSSRGGATSQARNPNLAVCLTVALGVQLGLLWLMWSGADRSRSTSRIVLSVLCGVIGAIAGTSFLRWYYRPHSPSRVSNFFAVTLVLSIAVTLVVIEIASGNYDLP